MVPAFTDIRALRRFTNGVQSKSTCQLFQLVEILPRRSFGPQPGWLGLPSYWPEFNLHQLRGAGHINILQEPERQTFPRLKAKLYILVHTGAVRGWQVSAAHMQVTSIPQDPVLS